MADRNLHPECEEELVSEGVALGIKGLPNGRVVGLEGANGSFGMAGDAALMPGDFEVDRPYGQSLDEHEVAEIDSRRQMSPPRLLTVTGTRPASAAPRARRRRRPGASRRRPS